VGFSLLQNTKPYHHHHHLDYLQTSTNAIGLWTRNYTAHRASQWRHMRSAG